MAKYRVVVVEKLFETFEEEKTVLSSVDADLEVFDCQSRGELIAAVQDAHGLLLHHIVQIDDGIIREMKRCKVISRYGVGYDNIDVKAATRAGIWVSRVPDYGADEDVADQALALLMACIREVCFKNRRIREGGWNLKTERKSYRIKGKVLGIIGYGSIGTSLQRKMSGFGLEKILVYDPYKDQDEIRKAGGTPVALNVLLKEADYISLHVPLSEETRHMIGERQFSMMKDTAILINTSRGPVVHEEALCEALTAGKIKASGIDVFEVEPLPKDSCLLALDNVILSDHTGYYSEESLVKLKTEAARNIAEVLKDGKPLYPVNNL